LCGDLRVAAGGRALGCCGEVKVVGRLGLKGSRGVLFSDLRWRSAKAFVEREREELLGLGVGMIKG
jgi:hypothetical protein